MFSRRIPSALARSSPLSVQSHAASRRTLYPLHLRRAYAASSQPGADEQPPRLNIYRDLWPSIISCLGCGFVVYYGLELWRTHLDYKWQAKDMAVEIDALKSKVERLQAEAAAAAATSAPSSSVGSASSGDQSSRKKWFGLF